MKNLILKKAVTLFTLVLFLSGCADNEKEEVVPEKLNCKLSSLSVIMDGSGIKFTYDAQDRITRIDPTSGNSGEYSTLENNSTGQVQKINHFESGGKLSSYSVLEYNPDGTVLNIKEYEKENGVFALYNYSAFEYNSAKQVQKHSFYINLPASSPWHYDLYVYNAAGNVSEIKTFNQSQSGYKLSKTSTFLYDDKKNPFYNLFFFSTMGGPEVFSPNNIKEVKITYPDGGVTEISKFNYEYNAQGLITKQTYEAQGTVIPFLNYTYACK